MTEIHRIAFAKIAELGFNVAAEDKIFAIEKGRMYDVAKQKITDFGEMAELYHDAEKKVKFGYNDNGIVINVEYSWNYKNGGFNGKSIIYRYNFNAQEWDNFQI